MSIIKAKSLIAVLAIMLCALFLTAIPGNAHKYDSIGVLGTGNIWAEDSSPPKPNSESGGQPDRDKVNASKEFYSAGVSAFESKEYDKAISFLSKAVTNNKDYFEAYAKLGETYEALKEFEELAYENYNKCLEIIARSTAPSEAMTSLSKTLAPKVEKFRAIEEKISAITNKTLLTWIDLGQNCLADTDYALAEEIFALVVKMESDNTEAQQSLQKVREELSKEGGEKAGEGNNELAKACYQSGLDLAKQNKFQEAIEKLKKALIYNPKLPGAMLKIAECSEKVKANGQAIQHYRQCIKYLQDLPKRSKEEDDLLNQAIRGLGKLDVNYNEFQKTKSEASGKLMVLANDCAGRRYYRFACRILKIILDMTPNNAEAQKLLPQFNAKIDARTTGPAQNFWTVKANMPTLRGGMTAGVIDNKIYVIGGAKSVDLYLNKNEVYDPATNSWSVKASMPGARVGLAVGVVNKKIYAIGGTFGAYGYLNKNEEYDPATNMWKSKANMPSFRDGMAIGVVNNKIYVIGGTKKPCIRINTNEAYDPAQDSWEKMADMPTARCAAACGVLNDKIYVIGGAAPDHLATNEEYDPAQNRWTSKADMSVARHAPAAGVVNNKIYVIGGSRTSLPNMTFDINEEYDPASDKWALKAPMPKPLAGIVMGVVKNRIYAIFGDVTFEYTP